jgi:hypothetical protein
MIKMTYEEPPLTEEPPQPKPKGRPKKVIVEQPIIEVKLEPKPKKMINLEILKQALYHKKNISSTELLNVLKGTEKTFYIYKGFIPFFSFKRLKEWYNNKYHNSRLFFIVMQLRNGKYDMFNVRVLTPYFEHRGGAYILDPDMAREDLHSKHNVLFYHQDFAAPFKITFDVSKIHDVICDSVEDKMVDKALNPSSVKRFIASEVIEKLLKADQLIDKLKFILILIVINLILTLIVAIIVGKSSGML